MGETFSSLAEWIHKRTTTTIIVTYISLWLTYHWQIIYVSLFVNEDKIYEKFALLKNEYVNQHFVQWNGFDTIAGYTIPGILTYLSIWVLPKFLFIKAFKKEREHKNERRIIAIESDLEIERKRARLATETTKVLKEQKNAALIEKDLAELKPESNHQQTLKQFMDRDDSIFVLGDIQKIIYEHHGHYRNYYDTSQERWVSLKTDPDYIAIADLFDLIEIDEDKEKITLTEKGRVYLKDFNTVQQQVTEDE